MAITPCESWPARLALTQPTATAWASSSDAPEALRRAAPMRVRRSAWTIGIGLPLEFPQARPRFRRVLLVVRAAWSQSAAALAIVPRQILGCIAASAMLRPHCPVEAGG